MNKPIRHAIFAGLLMAVILIILFGPFFTQKSERQIIISDADIAQIYTRWQRTWQRPPSDKELRGELQRFIREEVLYQEALRLGYDKNDNVIRNTLVRKMVFLAESQADKSKISDEEIKAYYNLRQEKYRLPPEFSFYHIYFNRDKRGNSAEKDVADLINRLNNSRNRIPDNPDSFGDRFMLENYFRNKSTIEIQNIFGMDFAEQIITLIPGLWSGPVYSGYGVHAVYIIEKQESTVPGWQEIKGKILNDMIFEELAAARDQFYTELMRQYTFIYQGKVEEILQEAQP